jgi:biotin-dependent carboxylase-like uncharacterized protein
VSDRALTVLRPGPLATVQDLGRPGYADVGVGPSGAADPVSHRRANRLVGNPDGAATVEATLGGLRVRAGRTLWVALTGAPAPADVDGRAVPLDAPLALPAGAVLTLGTPPAGLRTYLAVRGGVDVPPVLGSRSTDVLAGLGPAPLAAGDRLPIGTCAADWPAVDVAPVRPLPATTCLRLFPGPRRDWLSAGSVATLAAARWTVSAESNRVGVRLDGPALTRAVTGELAPEGLVRGAVQVPPSGQPIVFLADHPVTGGYPVVAVVARADLPLLAQTRPGQEISLRWTG